MGKQSRKIKSEDVAVDKNVNWLDKEEALEQLKNIYPGLPETVLTRSLECWRSYRALDGKRKKEIDKFIKMMEANPVDKEKLKQEIIDETPKIYFTPPNKDDDVQRIDDAETFENIEPEAAGCLDCGAN